MCLSTQVDQPGAWTRIILERVKKKKKKKQKKKVAGREKRRERTRGKKRERRGWKEVEERERWKGREFNEDSKDASHERIRSRDLRRINDRLRGLSQEQGRGGALKKEKKRVTEATSCAKTDRMNPRPALEPRERYTLLSLFRGPRWRKIKREKEIYIYIYIYLSRCRK